MYSVSMGSVTSWGTYAVNIRLCTWHLHRWRPADTDTLSQPSCLCAVLQGFHHEREDRGLTGYGAARAPTGPPSHLGPEGFRMLQVR